MVQDDSPIDAPTPPRRDESQDWPPRLPNGTLVMVVSNDDTPGEVVYANYHRGRGEWKYTVTTFVQGILSRNVSKGRFWESELRRPTSAEKPEVVRAMMEAKSGWSAEETIL